MGTRDCEVTIYIFMNIRNKLAVAFLPPSGSLEVAELRWRAGDVSAETAAVAENDPTTFTLTALVCAQPADSSPSREPAHPLSVFTYFARGRTCWNHLQRHHIPATNAR